MDQRTRRLGSQLCKAVKDGDPRLVQLLLAQGACPDLVGSKGAAAIHLAVGKETEKNTRCLKILLQFGANPNLRSSEGLTPVHIAALWGCFQNLKTLLMNGGDPNVTDNEGNVPRQLAEQQENRKCALLLQEYESSSADTEQDGFPQFQYSVYSDQSDTSSCPPSDYSFSSRSSIISDFGEAVLSSTRRSSLFNLSHLNGGLRCTGVPSGGLSDVNTTREDWNNSFAHWAAEAPSLLSSTRVSSLEHAAPMPVLKEDDLITYEDVFPVNKNNEQPSPSRRESLPALSSKRVSRKSVSFRDVDEYFPVFSPQSPRKPSINGSQCNSNLSFDLTEYSDFLDSERMATVLNKQGLDVTSPDHAYVFCRDSSTSTDEDMDKTVISHFASEESDSEQLEERVQDAWVAVPERPVRLCKGSSSSGTSGSHYSSCESDHYTSALDVSAHPRCEPPSEEEEVSFGARTCTFEPASSRAMGHDGNLPQGQTQMDTGAETLGQLFDEIKLEEKNQSNQSKTEAAADHSVAERTNSADKVSASFTAHKSNAVAVEVSDEVSDLPFTPSPFVTGRTRSRLSRCSMRTSRTPESLLTSSLFEETLPTPVRSRRQTPRSQSSEEYYRSPHVPCGDSAYPVNTTAAEPLAEDWQDTQSSTVRPGSCESISEADTFILSKSQTDPVTDSQTLSDTLVLENKQISSMDAYERNLEAIALAMRKENPSDGEFFTDDLTSTDEAATKVDTNTNPVVEEADSRKNEDGWITEDRGSQTDSASSSSSSSYFSPRRSREDSDPVSTPGTGCTPRYSMSRLPDWRRSHQLSNLSFTPGGRPLIQDLDEPVEYLYTDTEQGHKLIETHVPPTANTSLSSSMSSSSSEETILYDWRSLQADLLNNKGKENQQPQQATQDGQSSECEDSVLQKTKGMTDRELRLRLVELGESPGPISSRTRPTYMRRLCRLLQEPNSTSLTEQKQRDQPQVQTGYSPELSRVLQTFQLPNSQADEQELCLQFDQPDQNRKWREGIIKSSFNYLLLDPRVTKNLPFRSHTMTPQECFQTFVSAIFYVGKGKRSRPYSHLYEALEYYREEKTAKKLCPKVQHILQVWTAGLGVISLHCFQNVIPVEAYTREACMVEAIGLKMLTNQKKGDFYGVVSNWQSKRKRELGVHLLYRAMQIFQAEGERQLRPADIRQ